ncbi:MAG: hypothetical protein DME16_19275 [Candidatus Rokuibacteriota bacterium]|nr:MAG: hypothetical protein DME16_19275 [Candidatus Rokubacteria bacterium]
MAIVQAILALISRSLGSILSSLFGWAVVALFGQTTSREKAWLSGLVGAAAAWPILLLGIVWPRLATLVLAFVPLPSRIPTWSIRLVWVLLALAVPFALGIALAARARGVPPTIPGTAPATRLPGGLDPVRMTPIPHSPLSRSKGVRLLGGIPITLAIAASFFIVFVTTPVRRLLAIVRRQVDVQVPLVTDARGYELVAKEVAVTLTRHGFEVHAVEPPWWVTAPSKILFTFGGPSFRDYVPERLACLRGPRLEVVLYANGLAMRGSAQDTAWAHGLLVEALTAAPAYQTFDPGAQDIERQIRSVWAVFRQNPAAHVGAAALEARLDEITREIRNLPVDYEEWQIVYRQALQLDRALRGEKQMLKADMESELAMAKGLAMAVLVTVLGLNMLLVALVFALATVMPGWLAALLIGGGLVVIGGILGYVSWTRRVTSPLALTRKTIREDSQWVKERLA